MIELSVSLASNGVVKVPGYEQLVRFGYTKNRGVYRLAVTASGEWEGLTVRAFWHVPDGKDPASSLVVDGYVAVPASVTAQPGNGCITFEGSDGTTTVTSADLRYRVSANSGTEDGTEPEPGTSAWQQLVDAVHADATAAEQAKTDAQTAAQQAGASAQKAEQALSDTITAKEDALKAIGDKQTAATQAVDTARDKAIKQVEASTKAAQTAASEAATSAGNADQSAQEAADSLQELKDGIAAGDFKGEPGNDGKSPVVAVTDIENGHRVSITDKDGTKTIDVLNGQTGKTGATPVLTIGTVSSGDKPSADITGTPENPVLNLRLKPGPQGPAVALDTTLTHEGEAADAKATGEAIGAVKARQNILVGTETGNPISVDDAFSAPLCSLTVYGRSTQDGTPTPDAPVPIVSAGDSGSLTVKVTGKNLIPTNCGQNTTALRYDAQYNRWVFDALKAVGLVSARIIDPETARYLLAAGTYTITLVSSENVQNVTISAANADWKTLASVTPDRLSKTFSVNANTIVGCYFVPTDVNATGYLQVQFELGKTVTAYSPYREQLLTLPTPTGLPGIPVTSGGNYTDQSGQQWVCDEVNLERGVKVQRIGKAEVTSTYRPIASMNRWDTVGLDKVQPFRLDAIHPIPKSTVKCTALPEVNGSAWGKTYECIGSVNELLDFYIANERLGTTSATTSAEALKALLSWLETNPFSFIYALATPIETPLTPDEIAAYKALTAYGPDTVVQASDGAGVKLGYQRDVNIAIKKLEDAVASMT